MTGPETMRNRLLTLIATIMAVTALHWSYPVTMPIGVAVFIIAAVWPIKPWLDHVLPPRLSYAGTFLALLLILAAFFAIIYQAFAQLAQAFTQDQELSRSFYETYEEWANKRGLPVPGGEGGYDRIVSVAQALFWQLYALIGYLGVIATLVILGLPEVPTLAARFREQLSTGENRELVDTVAKIAEKFRSYVKITFLTSLITGGVSAVWAYSIGLDLALTWGVLNFILNFVPIIGNFIGIVLPTLYAFIQFDGATMPLVAFGGCAALQITIGTFVYPILQGRDLALPPVSIVLALMFWGAVWGLVGALLAVPLTAAIVIACQHFKSTEWIARLLVGRK